MENRNMNMKSVLLLLCVLVLIISALSSAHVVRSASGGTIFYKEDVAFLYLGSGHDGWRFSYLKYPLVIFLEYFNVPVPPSDRRHSTTVFRITPSGVVQQNIDYGEDNAGSPLFVTPFGDNLYGMCLGGVLCRWSGGSFQPATEEEQKQFGGIDHLDRGGRPEGPHDGWITQPIGTKPNQNFEIDVAGKFKIVARNDATNGRQHPKVVIDLVRPGRPKENLYNVDGATRWVS